MHEGDGVTMSRKYHRSRLLRIRLDGRYRKGVLDRTECWRGRECWCRAWSGGESCVKKLEVRLARAGTVVGEAWNEKTQVRKHEVRIELHRRPARDTALETIAA